MPDASHNRAATGKERISQSYQLYFTSGHYDRRYPGPNLTMWRHIRAHLSPSTSLIDFGCGSGRYLLAAKGLVAKAAGFDISPAALAILQDKAREMGWNDLSILGPDPASLQEYVDQTGPADVVLCLFGVLGHIAQPAERRDALSQIRAALKPGSGRLIVSVPNIARRFRAEQRAAGPGSDGLVQYTRVMDGDTIDLDYQLFDEARLSRELQEAGFTVHRIGCESVLPENLLLTRPIARWADSFLTLLCPLRLAYGLFAEASC